MAASPLRQMTRLLTLVALLGCCERVLGEAATFDLPGPAIAVAVTRAGSTLPITRVPSLAPGDRLQIVPKMPPAQTAKYLLIAVFLRGPTNPPPDDWFHRCDTWSARCQSAGLALTVPDGAEQLLLFFAPKTGGDYSTLVSTVKGRPGAFVRAAQALNQAGLDRNRLERYLAAVRTLGDEDPTRLKKAAPVLARSLGIKVEDKCLDRLPTLQAACLTQGQEALILSDGHGPSTVATLTSGAATDLAMQAGNTSLLGSGSYLPFIGSVIDLAKLLDSLYTARYQYIPALALARHGQLQLLLNAPPSFHDPLSVLVTALPLIEPSVAPPLHPVSTATRHCAARPSLDIALEASPYLYAAEFLHDLTLRVTTPAGATSDLPGQLDPEIGGVRIDTARLAPAAPDPAASATLEAQWGFARVAGVRVALAGPAERSSFTVTPGEESALVAGRQGILHVRAGDTACVSSVTLRPATGAALDVPWKPLGADQLELALPLQGVAPGPATILIAQHGSAEPAALEVTTYADTVHLERLGVHAGDRSVSLTGTRLDLVTGVVLKGVTFLPRSLRSVGGADELALEAADAPAPGTLAAGERTRATVRLNDGRELPLAVAILAPRPRAELLDRSVQTAPTAGSLPIELGDADVVDASGRLTFSVHATAPTVFGNDLSIELATAGGDPIATLGAGHGGLTLANNRVAIASVVPAAAFGASAFGEVRFRVTVGGVSGDWQHLGTLVRLPTALKVTCPESETGTCRLEGENLFLLEAVASGAEFSDARPVPEGLAAAAIEVPRPLAHRLYVRLRDDPAAVGVISVERPAGDASAMR